MRTRKIASFVLLLLLMGFFTSTLYAAESMTGVNVTEGTYIKNGKTYECLYSADDDSYLQITQIIPNSQNVKINTYVDDNRLLISGVISKETELTIKVFNKGKEEATSMYSLVSTGTFTQSVEIPEGENKIIISYNNKKADIENHMAFIVTRAKEQSITQIKNFLVTPNM